MVRVTRGSPTPTRPKVSDGAAPVSDSVLKDGRISDAEWRTKVEPCLQQASLESPQVRAFLDVYADGSVAFDPQAATAAAELLRAHGYEVPGRDTGIRIDVRIVVEGNAAAPDHAFEKLSALTGTDQSRAAIAVVDGGFSSHPVLDDNLSVDGRTLKAGYGASLGKAFGKRSADAQREGAEHGTHVAGIATQGSSRIQATLLAVPLETAAEASGQVSTRRAPLAPDKQPIVQALAHAAARGASVVNVSIEAFVTDDEVAAYRRVMEKYPETLFVFGAGNDHYELGSATEGGKTLVEQLKLPNLAVVGASYPDGGRWNNSNFGASFVQLAARGHYIASADSDGDGFRIESGTSMAAPAITNLAAKCRMLHPALTPAQLITLMSVTSEPHHAWKSAVASGGTVHPVRAMTAAAALALVARGEAVDAALSALGVTATELPRIRDAVRALS